MDLHMLSQMPLGCRCDPLLLCVTAPRILTNFSPYHVKSSFRTDKTESIEWQLLVTRQRTGECLLIHIPHWRTSWSADIKSPNFSARSRTSPVRFLQGALVIWVLKQTSQFRSLIKWVSLTWLPKPKACNRGEQKLAQYWKSKLRISWNAKELKLRWTWCKNTVLHLGLWSANVSTNTNWPSRREQETIHYEEVALGSGPPAATTQKEQFIPSSSTILQTNQRKWIDISAVGNIDQKSLKIQITWLDFYDMKVILEKMTGELKNERC